MRRWNRALTTLVGAAAVGFLLWFTPHFNRFSTSGYWGVMALLALAGLLLGVSQLHARDGNPAASFLFAFLPVLVAAGWVLLAAQPDGNWFRDHVLSWSGDLGIGHGVHNLAERATVVAFGLGVVFGVTFEPRMLRRREKKVFVPAAPVAAPVVEEPTVEHSAPERDEADEHTLVEPPA